MRFNLKLWSRLALPSVLFTALLNHAITFFAYDWYAGIDNYSYDVAGLQLVSGAVFDLFPIVFRPPLTPIFKNILYLLFEGHPYLLSLFIHLLGVLTAILAYRLGNRFHKAVGFTVGMLVALNLPMSVNFHHISPFTFFIPLLLLSADCFIVWSSKPDLRSLVFLVITTSLCFLSRVEAIILIPVFAVFGVLIQRRFKPAAIFLLSCMLIYNLVSLFYYKDFGYWGITYNKGWSLFTRIARASDRQFSKDNGPASRKVYDYLCQEWPARVKDIDPFRHQMFALSLAQKELGLIKADDLFLQASLESISSDPGKFMRFTLLRLLGQLDLYYTPGLNYKEFLYETDSGHMWGFEEERMIKNSSYFDEWRGILSSIKSPLQWEGRAIKIRLLRALGFKYKIPEVPEAFRMMQIVELEPSGEIKWLYCGDSNMTERLWYCRDLDVYFCLGYWGQRGWSRAALKILKYWDMILMPRGNFRINIHRIMWLIWLLGIFLISPRWRSLSLAALLCIAILYAFCLVIFSDNFGGRHELYMRIFLWLGASCGVLGIIERCKKYKKRCGI